MAVSDAGLNLVTSLLIPWLSTRADNKTSIPSPIIKYSVSAGVSTEMQVVLYSICKKVVWVHPYPNRCGQKIVTDDE